LPVEVSIPTALAQVLAAQNQVSPPPATGIALIDTGATRSCVDSKIISQCSLCGTCTENCPNGVAGDEIIREARSLLAKGKGLLET
jgi:heterodisulfide reductase subunit C